MFWLVGEGSILAIVCGWGSGLLYPITIKPIIMAMYKHISPIDAPSSGFRVIPCEPPWY